MLLAISVGSVGVGISFGNIISGFTDSGSKQSLIVTAPRSDSNPVQPVSWSGTIRKVTPVDVNINGGFKLVNGSEKIIAILQSTRIDLGFLEGMNVTVEGRRARSLNSELPLIIVEKVRFK